MNDQSPLHGADSQTSPPAAPAWWTALDLVRLARPDHWVKNGLVLVPLVFAQRLGDATAWARAALATAAFCFASGAVYSVNAVLDRVRDREHPIKRNRPVAAGRVPPGVALAAAAVWAALAVGVAWRADAVFLAVVLAYWLLQAAYMLSLKDKMILDVVCIALGFVLRAAGGALAIRVAVSPWLVVCTFTICLFMGFCKRRSEVAFFAGSVTAANHRRTLAGYTPELLTHLTTLSAGIAIVSYLMYASSPRTVENFGTDALIYTLPLVVYGVCRFAMLSIMGTYLDPTDLVLRDRPFQATVALWGACVLGIILWGRELTAWVESWL